MMRLGWTIAAWLTLTGCNRCRVPPGRQLEIPPPSSLGPEFLAQQKVTVEQASRRFEFRAVLQLKDGVLTLVMLSAWGGRGLVLRQTSAGVEKPGREFTYPFDPAHIFADLHRSFDRPPKGGHEHAPAGERLIETWRGQRLVHRSYRWNGCRNSRVEVEYPEGMLPGRLPARVELENRRFDYRLSVETLEQKRL